MTVSRDTHPVAPVGDTLPLELIDSDPDQPRRIFDPATLSELADSMDTVGLAEPIVVRPVGDRYVIVCGERRWRAAKLRDWTEIPARVMDIAPADVPFVQLAENIARESLSPVEEARSFKRLLDAGATQKDVAARIGKDRSYVAQKLRLLDLPAHLTLLVDRGALKEGHVRQLLRIKGLYTSRHVAGALGDGIDYGAWARVWDGGIACSCDVDGCKLGDVTDPTTRTFLTFEMLKTVRPEDWPPGYPFEPKEAILHDAAEALGREAAELGAAMPYWHLTSFYWAALTVKAGVSVGKLDVLIDSWVARIHAALVWVRDVGLYEPEPEPKVSRDTLTWARWKERELLWWGHRADLRHAGLLDRNDHITFEDAMGVMAGGSIPLPSSCQPWGCHHEVWERVSGVLRDHAEGIEPESSAEVAPL